MKALFNLSRFSAGAIAVIVGYTSSVVIIFQAASAAGASEAQISSWLWALGLGMGVTCIGFSLAYKQPVLTAWSTPGAALLVTGLSGVSLNEAIAAFLFSSALIMLTGLLGWFDRIMAHVPRSLAGAMLAGVLLPFGMDVFVALGSEMLLVGAMLLAFIVLRPMTPRYAVPVTLLLGLALAWGQGLLATDKLSLELAEPVLMMPEFSASALIGVGLPLFVVTMASQNVPGLAVLRAHGYEVPASPLMSWTGLTGLILAPFGGFAFNLAAITAAICMGEEADPDRDKRYLASVWAGIFYLLMGLFGATVVALFAAFPRELVMAIAGLALLGTIGNSLAASLADEEGREAALITFLVTASGVSLFGVGSAFWALVIGMGVYRFRLLTR
ncbi:MAG: benzoate/H(+) symporter BenE family transporter [Gammaproteobacteria bacterium]